MFSKAIVATALLSAVSAHQNFHQFWVNDETPGYQVGIRMPPSNSPVEDITSNDMACNVGGSKVPSGVVTVEAAEGDTIKVQWDSSSHPGPITHFLLPVEDATQATGVGAGWFKIDEQNQVDGKWANEIMQASNMTHEFKLPTGLASGEYLLRSEMLALHGAQTVGGAQFYIGCAQLKITGTGSKDTCGPTISLPGAYKADDANVYIPNVYNGFDATTYKAPGGPVASCGAGSGSGSGSGSAPAAPASSAAAPAASSAASSAAATPVETPAETPAASATSVVAEATSAAPSAPPAASASASASAAAPAASSAPSDGALPAEFTLETFIAWLKEQAV